MDASLMNCKWNSFNFPLSVSTNERMNDHGRDWSEAKIWKIEAFKRINYSAYVRTQFIRNLNSITSYFVIFLFKFLIYIISIIVIAHKRLAVDGCIWNRKQNCTIMESRHDWCKEHSSYKMNLIEMLQLNDLKWYNVKCRVSLSPSSDSFCF